MGSSADEPSVEGLGINTDTSWGVYCCDSSYMLTCGSGGWIGAPPDGFGVWGCLREAGRCVQFDRLGTVITTAPQTGNRRFGEINLQYHWFRAGSNGRRRVRRRKTDYAFRSLKGWRRRPHGRWLQWGIEARIFDAALVGGGSWRRRRQVKIGRAVCLKVSRWSFKLRFWRQFVVISHFNLHLNFIWLLTTVPRRTFVFLRHCRRWRASWSIRGRHNVLDRDLRNGVPVGRITTPSKPQAQQQSLSATHGSIPCNEFENVRQDLYWHRGDGRKTVAHGLEAPLLDEQHL